MKDVNPDAKLLIFFQKETELRVCDVDPSLKEKLKKFRFRKETDNAVIIIKIDKDKQLVVLDEEKRDCTIDEVREDLPESQPRYLVYSYQYEHDDGRKSYPLCFIFVSPQGCSPELQMMYAGSMRSLVADVGLTKIFECRILEDLTEEWLREKLQFFR